MSDQSNTSVVRRSRRRLAIWLAFAALGISMGAVWAAGFATFGGGSSGSQTASPVVAPGSPSASEPLSGLVTSNGGTWTVTWSGAWGTTPAFWFFQVDLSSQAAGNHYNVATLLTNGAALTAATQPWQTLQLKMELHQAAGASCAATDFDGTLPRVFVFDSNDSGVYWNDADGDVNTAGGITGGKKWCVGIEAASPPYDGTGTFLRSASSTATPNVYPSFVTTVNRVS
jgi:hypothetical protein